MDFKGAARRLTDYDLPRIGSKIGVGEDVLHAIIDVEAPRSGFDTEGRPRILFEPHIFYRELGPGAKRDRAVREGLAYATWRTGTYGSENAQYDKLTRAIAIDRKAALRSCSWGRGQIMGFNHELAGFATVDAMVNAYMASEAAQIEGMVAFIASKKLDVHLRRIEALKRSSTPDDWRPVASGYNGTGYAKNDYHTKLAQRYNFWRNIPDTPWSPEMDAANTADAVPVEALPTAPALPPDVLTPLPPAPPAAQPGFLARFFAAFLKRLKG